MKRGRTKIEWAEDVWNPVTGCNKISQGCKFCYAATMHKRLQGMGLAKYQRDFELGPVTHENELLTPLLNKKPTIYFSPSMSDLFHKDVPWKFIDRVYHTIANCPQHRFLILTKRSDIMAAYHADRQHRIYNVMHGVSVEDQENARVRIPDLVRVPGPRFLSCEPLLGPLQLRQVCQVSEIDWVICGGESGGARVRPMHPRWVKDLREECARASVPFFFKQWGQFMYFRPTELPAGSRIRYRYSEGRFHRVNKNWSPVAETTDELVCVSVGKKVSGALLDGQVVQNLPAFFTQALPDHSMWRWGGVPLTIH